MFDRPVYHPHVTPLRAGEGAFVTRDWGATGARDGTPFAVTFDDPQPPFPVNVAWAIDGRAASVAPASPSDRSAYVDPASGGRAIVRAYVGPPVDLEIDAPVYAYRSFAIGCANRPFTVGVRFALDGSAIASAADTSSDLYVRGSDCGTTRRSARAIVAPLGFTFVATRSIAEFARVNAATWRAGGTTAAGLATYGTLLARLRDGGTLKFFMKSGARAIVDAPYAIAPAGREFDDVTFDGAAAGAQSVRRLPDSIRIPSATAQPAQAEPEIGFAARFRARAGGPQRRGEGFDS
jgi:hypothetical protein